MIERTERRLTEYGKNVAPAEAAAVPKELCARPGGLLIALLDDSSAYFRQRTAPMPRVIVIGIACVMSLFVLQVSDAQSKRVDLNEPGALAALQQENPEHHRKVVAILEQVRTQRVEDVSRWMEATFDARDVYYAPLLLTSNPPKRDLSFVLDDTRYEARLTLTHITLESMLRR